MTRARPSLLLLLAFTLPTFACTPSDGDDDVADTATDDATTDSATDDATDDSATATDTGPDPFDFPPVDCDGMTCAQGLLCVKQGLNCDYGQDPPMFYTPDGVCTEVPADCLDASEATVADCLGPLVCDFTDGAPATFMAGKVQCPAVAPDCF